MSSQSSLSPYENMSLKDIIIAECTNAEEEKFVKDVAQNMQQQDSSSRRGSKKRVHRDRGREDGHKCLFDDYFAEHPVYGEHQFRRRFQMRRHIFLRIVESLENHSEYFRTRVDATGKKGLSPLQKCIAAMGILAYGVAADSVDEYVRIGESTVVECVVNFVWRIYIIFGEEYLRRLNPNDIDRLLQMGEARGFPGMLGSIDCMHWVWKNCPIAWKGQFTRGDHGRPTIILEAVASQDLWIWHAFFGVPGSNNDLNVLNQSPLFTEVLQGRAPLVEFTVNSTQYNTGYYLADGIYPQWSTFVKTIPLPQGEKRQLFARCQEGVRKDVERAFGVLQSRFAIIRGSARFWEREVIKDIMYACIIMDNMIVDDERDLYEGIFDYNYDEGLTPSPAIDVSQRPISDFSTMLRRNHVIRDREIHRNLQADLVEHIWSRFGSQEM